MRGVVFTGDREIELMEFPDPTPGAGEVVVEMKASGMCGSDLHQYRRPKSGGESIGGLPVNPNPVIGGHEPCGIVAAVGPGVSDEAGAGRPARHGAPLQGLHRVRPLPLGLVAAVPGRAGDGLRQQRPWRPRPLSEGAGLHGGAAARRAVVRCRRGDLLRHRHRLWRVAPAQHLGQRHDRACSARGRSGCRRRSSPRAMGARVIALDVSPERLERAKEFGAGETVNPRSNDPVGAIKDLTHGGAEFTLDTSSQPEGRIAAVRSAKVWGTICFVGERNNVTIDVSPDMLRKQLTIVASWTFSWQGQADCAQLRRRPQGRCRPPVHPPLEARPGRRGLSAVRHADHRQGRVLDVTLRNAPRFFGQHRQAAEIQEDKAKAPARETRSRRGHRCPATSRGPPLHRSGAGSMDPGLRRESRSAVEGGRVAGE